METTQMAVCKMEYYSAMKKNETSLFEATLLNLENVILQWSKSYRKRQIYMTSLICKSKIWHKGTYLANKNRFIETEIKLIVIQGEVGGETKWN